MATTTRTLNPLPFGDLEPKRFEDLVRQLAYDFKPWRRLEATGRSGSDEGFDARGYERLNIADATPVDNDEDTESVDNGDAPPVNDRLWLIQCKREKKISPAKIVAHLDEIVLDPAEPLYGIVFAAACDFSKATRDRLAAWCRANGVSEWHIWGKAELEDMLFQPKNDGLLFAYFGISLTIRRRSQTVALRSQVAIKKKLKRLIESSREVLLRDIDASEYPVSPRDGTKPRWIVRTLSRLSAYGLVVELSRRPGWISVDADKWDAAFAAFSGRYSYRDLWNKLTAAEEKLCDGAMDVWRSLPEAERAWITVEGFLPYDRIILIDELGDEFFDGPHIYVSNWSAAYGYREVEFKAIQYPYHELDFHRGLETPGREAKFPEETRHWEGKGSGL